MVPTFLDHLLVLFFAVLLPVRGAFVAWPRLNTLLTRDGARMRFYRQTGMLHIGLIVVALIAWIGPDRDWGDLGLVPRDLGLLAAGIAAAVVGLGLHYLQAAAALRRPETRAHNTARLQRMQPLIPHTRRELDYFSLLGVIASFSEELLFRAFLPAYLASFMPLGTAAGISVLAFGLGHAYQGMVGVIQTTVIGAVLMIMYLLTESLWPGVIFHAGFNMISAHVGYLLLRSQRQ